MSDHISNPEAANLKDKNDSDKARHGRTEGWMKRAKGLLMVLVLGLMLACNTAYASEPSSAAPTVADTKLSQFSQNGPISSNIGDAFFTWTIILCIILLVLFFSIQFWDSRKKDKE